MPGKSIDQATFIQDPAWCVDLITESSACRVQHAHSANTLLYARRLTIVNAIQLAVALVSNAFLLLNMTKRIRFSIAQPITIIGW